MKNIYQRLVRYRNRKMKKPTQKAEEKIVNNPRKRYSNSMMQQFHGSITALVTPFINDQLDMSALEKLVEWQIASGTHALVPVGTTGESPTVTMDEHLAVIKQVVRIANQRVPVIAGTGSNATHEAIYLTQKSEELGASAALIVAPYYNKPTQAGIVAHYTAIHQATNLPIILYNVPGRTLVDMHEDTVVALANLPRIVGLKDATGDLSRPAHIKSRVKNDFILLGGEDDLALQYRAQGGLGCISVTSNIAPKLCASMHNFYEQGKLTEAEQIQNRLMPLHKILFCETSPAPVKYALARLGRIRSDLRLPLVLPSQENQTKIDSVLEQVQPE
jgi:4-hydroxy-tetrahydrodipicolinate synthase